MRTTILVVTSLFAAACGGNPLDPGAGSSLGTGSHTLTVNGSASAESSQVGTRDTLAFTTHFDIRIAKDQVPVTAGTVTMSSNGGDVALTFDSADGGHWVGDQAGYFEVYGLDVTAGSDSVTGVRIDGPDLHTFTAPTLGATVDTSAPLAIAWARDDHADVAELSTRETNHVAIDDSGTYAMAAGFLKSSRDKIESDTISLRRAMQVMPAGATAGSMVAVSVRNAVDVVVAINPNAP
jgi:hypothetical protein